MIDQRIKTFLTLCKTMSYRRTAEELHLTQPAITQHIQYLERELGCKLFTYDRRSLSMTEEARTLQAFGESLLYQETQMRARLQKPAGRHLNIGATKTIGEFVIAGQAARYLAEAGNTLTVKVDNTEHLLAQVAAGKLDFALVEGFFERSAFASRLYSQEEFVGICAASHPFAGKRVSLEELLGEHLLVREEGSGTRDILEQLLAEHNHRVGEFQKVTTISNFGLLLQVLQQVGGITFAYEAVLRQGNTTGLASFRLMEGKVSREFNYVYLDNDFAAEAVEEFERWR